VRVGKHFDWRGSSYRLWYIEEKCVLVAGDMWDFIRVVNFSAAAAANDDDDDDDDDDVDGDDTTATVMMMMMMMMMSMI
jgi:hypothetical protein